MDVDPLIIGRRVAALSTRTRLAPPPLSRAPAGDRRFANSSRKLKLLYQNDRPAADFSGNARESISDALPRMKVSFHYGPEERRIVDRHTRDPEKSLARFSLSRVINTSDLKNSACVRLKLIAGRF